MTRIGDKVCILLCDNIPKFLKTVYTQERSVAAQELAFEKTPGVGSKIDIVLTLVRIGPLFGDHLLISKNLTRAEEYAFLAS